MVDVASSGVKSNNYPTQSSFLPDTKAMSNISEGPMSDSRESGLSV